MAPCSHRPEITTAALPGDADDVPFPVQSPVTHKKWGAGLVMRYEDDVITVLFEREGYKTLSREAVMKRKLLKPA